MTIFKQPVLRVLISLLGAVLAAGFLVALGFTHTQIGRDALKSSLEDWFAKSLDGRLTVGTIRGNLLWDLDLQDVRLYDASDSLMIRAETVTMRPHWLDLPKREFNVRAVNIQNVVLYARYLADSTWNVTSILRRRTAKDSRRSWELESARISVSGGRIMTTRESNTPLDTGNVRFLNVTDLTLDSLNLEAQLNWQADERFLRLHNLNAHLPEQDVTLNSVAGEAVRHDDQWHINSLRLESGPNLIDLTGLEDHDARMITFFIRESAFTPTFVRTLWPEFAVDDTFSLTGTIGVAPQLARFEGLTVKAEHSFVTASGLLDGMSFDFTVTDGAVEGDFLQALLPTAPALPPIDSLKLEARGSLDRLSAQVDATLEVHSTAGNLTGSISAQRESAWSYTASVAADDWDSAQLPRSFGLIGTLRGNATITGSGWRAPNVNILANLSAILANGRSLDSLHLAANYADRQLSGAGSVSSGGSYMDLEGNISWTDDMPVYQVSGRAHKLDIAVLWPDLPVASSLDGEWTISGTGLGANDAVGTLEIRVDSSEVSWSTGRSALLPHQWSAALSRPQTNEIRLTIGGDALDLDMTGTLEFAALRAVGDAWLTAVQESMKRQADKVRSRPRLGPPAVWLSLDQILAAQFAADALMRAALDELTINAQWQILQGNLLSALPVLESGQTGSVTLRADARSMDLEVNLSGAGLSAASWSAKDAAATLQASARMDSPLEESLSVTGHVQVAQVSGLGPDLIHTSADWHLDGSVGHLRLDAGTSEGARKGAIMAAFEAHGDRNRIMVDTAAIDIGGDLWQIQRPARVDLFADGAVFDPLVLESTIASTGRSQRLQISGALSSAPADTLKVSLDNLVLEQVSKTLGLDRLPIGGNLKARLQWTGLGRPELTGTVHVDTLSVNRRVVGSFQTESRLLPGGDDLQVRIIIRPPGSIPNNLTYTENDLTVDGRVSLPGTGRTGQLDLTVDARRVDAGFLEEFIPILDGVTGGILGGGMVRGPINSPDLDIALSWPDGVLTIPRHNTTYAADASFNLLREGIQITNLQLTDPDGGIGQVGGWLHFNDYKFLSYDLQGQLDALQIMNVPTFARDLAFYGDLRASGDATLAGPSTAAFLKSDNLITTPQSELLIPIRELDAEVDPGFIIYADSTRSIAEQISATRAREHLLERRPEGERDFRTGLDMDLNIHGPPGSSIRLVIDPLLGDVINGIGTARVQLQRQEGQMLMYGRFDLTSGDYLFTAGEVFVRRFLISEGVIIWEGDPTNPRLNIQASYRTRASRSGLPDDVSGQINTSLPLIVELHITGTLNAVQVGLNLAIDQRREAISDTPLLEGYLNQPDRAAEHATSVLLTNSFLLSAQGGSTDVLAGSAFNSVSSLVANQLNRYLGQVVPNADFTLGVQSDETAADLDVSAGIALRLLDERLVIRGHGVYRSLSAPEETAQAQALEGEFVVELRLRPDVAVEVFYRRESDALSETLMTRETGLGVNYRAEFVSWKRLWKSIFRRKRTDPTAANTERAQPQ